MITAICQRVRDELLASMRENGFWTGWPERLLSHDPTVWDINDGFCGDFADKVISQVEEADEMWLDDVPDGDYNHVVVLFEGRYYDAECCEGVDDWKKLPIVLNRGKTRQEVTGKR